MKKILLIFIFFFLFVFENLNLNNLNKFCRAEELEYKYLISYNDKTYTFKSSDFIFKLSEIQNKNYHNLKTLKKLKDLGFSEEEVLKYVFPETIEIFSKLSKNFNIDEVSDKVFVKSNSCELEYINGSVGKCVNKQKFFKDCFNQIEEDNKNLNIKIDIKDYKNHSQAKDLFREKSCFSTSFVSSSEERKNNIKIALKALDGLIIEEGEIFSFNQITGQRNLSSGYKEAKIISGGTFVNGVGGGVCQVSTTLYNTCLLAGLEVIEATSHSLPVSYVEPSFDAMVSFGSSDLKIRNNSGGKIIITTSSKNDICKIKIFGLKNKYKITRQSEKISIIPAQEDVLETDYKKYGNYELEIGEEKRLSYSKDGFISRGYLNYYDEKGRLVKRQQIRENRYNPTKGVILKREK